MSSVSQELKASAPDSSKLNTDPLKLLDEMMFKTNISGKDLRKICRSLSPRWGSGVGREPIQQRSKSYSPPRYPNQRNKAPENLRNPSSPPYENMSSSTSRRTQVKFTLKNTKRFWWSQVGLAILEAKFGTLSEEDIENWQLDVEFWKVPQEPDFPDFSLEKIPEQSALPQKKSIEKSERSSPELIPASPPKKEKRTYQQYGKYHFGIIKKEQWTEFRRYQRVLENLQFPLILKQNNNLFSVVVIFKREIDLGPVERKLFGVGDTEIFEKQENVDKLLHKLKAKNNEKNEQENMGGESEKPNMMEEMGNVIERRKDFSFGVQEETGKKSNKRKREETSSRSRKDVKITSEDSKCEYEQIHKIFETQYQGIQNGFEKQSEEIQKNFELYRSQVKKSFKVHSEEVQKNSESQIQQMQQNIEFQRKEMTKSFDVQRKEVQQSFEVHRLQTQKNFEKQFQEIHQNSEFQRLEMKKGFENQFEEIQRNFQAQISEMQKHSQSYRLQLQKDSDFSRQQMMKNLDFQRQEMQKTSELQLQQMKQHFEIQLSEMKKNSDFQRQQMQQKEAKPFFERLWDLFKN